MSHTPTDPDGVHYYPSPDFDAPADPCAKIARLTAGISEAMGMIANCADAPTQPDSLTQMVFARLAASLDHDAPADPCAVAAAVKAEREACAMICEDIMEHTRTPLRRAKEDAHDSEINHQEGRWHAANDAMRAIRARTP